MPTTCSAYGCKYRYKKGSLIRTFRFPKDENLRQLWVNAMKRKHWQPNRNHSRICGQHFQTGKPSQDKNHPDYVPNIFVFSTKKRNSAKVYERRLRTLMKKEASTDNATGHASLAFQSSETANSTDYSALKKCTDELESSIKIKSEPLDDSYEASAEIQEKNDASLLQQTDLQLEINKKANSTSTVLPSSSPKPVVNGTSMVEREIVGIDPLFQFFPSISQKILSKPGPKCKKLLYSPVIEKKVPDGPPLILPKQPETCSVQNNLQNSSIVLLPATSQNTVGNPNGIPSYLLIITPEQKSSNPKKEESSNASQDRQTSSPFVSSSFQGFSKLNEDQLETAPVQINLESENPCKIKETDGTNLDSTLNRETDSSIVTSSYSVIPELLDKQHESIPDQVNKETENSAKRIKIDHTLNEDVNQICSQELMDSTFEKNLKFEKSLIELAKEQILDEILKHSHAAESDDLMFFRSLLPHVSKIPDSLKLHFRSRIQEVVDEFVTGQTKSPR